MSAIQDYLKKLSAIFGSMGFSFPPDDFSGIVVDGKTYPVMMRNDGCYVYFDDNGKKIPVSELPRSSYEFVNIKDARVSIVNQCYRTPGGQVEARIHTYMNSKGEILAEKIVIVNSTDVDTPIGTELESIPGGWVAIDCSIAEMTDRELVFVSKCYSTPGGKVEIEGVESVDPRLGLEVAHYEVVRTTDDDIPAGTEYKTIPDNWKRVVCDFPDMTQREILPVLKCYDTEGGRIQIEGYIVFDYEMGTRKQWYRIKQSTDPDNAVGKIITGIDGDWEEVVCDFTDMEDRDIEVTIECYKTPGGKVKLEVLTSWDGNIGTRGKSYKVLETTDSSQPQDSTFTSLPSTWSRTVCDFTDLEDRNILVYDECYEIDGNKLRMEHTISYDGDLGMRKEKWTVVNGLDNEDSNYVTGTVLSSIPSGMKRVDCTMIDGMDRVVTSSRECYRNSDGGIIRTTRYRSSRTDLVGEEYDDVWVVESSTIDGMEAGHRLYTMSGYTQIECEEPDYMDRLIDTTETCYDTGNGMVKIRRQESLNGNLDLKTFDYKVVDSTDPDYPVNTTPTQTVIDTWTVISCDLNIMDVDACYEVDGKQVHIKGFRTINPALQDIKSKLYVIRSESDEYPAGTELSSIPDNFVMVECEMLDMDQFSVGTYYRCFMVDERLVKVNVSAQYGYDHTVRKEIMTVVNSDTDSVKVGETYTSIPSGWTAHNCKSEILISKNVYECYSTATGKIYVEGYNVTNEYMEIRHRALVVKESTDSAYPVGMVLTALSPDLTRIECLCLECNPD